MMKEHTSPEEEHRLAILDDLAVLETQPDADLDELTLLLAQICETPIAAISIIDRDRLYLKSKVGVSAHELPRAGAPCTHLLGQTELLLVPDTLEDERFATHLLVTGETQVRMYAGAPLLTPEGEVLGTLCVLDQKPRHLSEVQLKSLRVLARQVMTHILARREERERRRMAQALKDSEERWQLALASSELGVWDWNAQTDEVFYSDLWCTMLGYAPEEISCRAEEWSSRIHPDDLPLTMERLNEHLEGNSACYRARFRMRAKDGSYRWILDQGRVILRDQDGSPLRMLGTHMDITEQKQAEEALRLSEANMAMAQRIAHFGSWERDVRPGYESSNGHGALLHWSEEMYRIAGLPSNTAPMSSATFYQMVPEEDHEVIRQAVAAAFERRTEYSVEHRLIRPDGSVRLIQERAQLVFDNVTGQPLKWVGMAHDLTEQRQAEQKIHSTTELLQALADSTPDALFVKDLQGRYQYFSHGAARLVGKSVEEVLGRDDTALFPHEDAQVVMAHDRQVMESNAVLKTEETLTAAGVTRTYLAIKAPQHDHAGKVTGLIGISRDITERKIAEEKMNRMNRLYAVASGISEALLRIEDSAEIYGLVCRIAVEQGGLHLAWVGLADVESQEIRPVAWHGHNDGYLDHVKVSTHPDFQQHSLSSRAYYQGQPCISNDLATDPDFGPWVGEALARGYRSCVVLPLRQGGTTVGTYTLCSDTPGYFDSENLRLLQSVVGNIAFAIEAHEQEKQRLQAEASHRESEERFREMADKIGEVFYNYDALQHRLLYANQAYERISGISREAVYADPFSYLRAVHPDDFPFAEEALHLQLAGQETNREFRIVRPDGEIRWVHEHGVPVFNGSGQVERIVGTVRDITESKLADEKIRQSEERFRLLSKATNDAIWDWNLITKNIWWNEVFETLFGYPPEEIGTSIDFWFKNIHPDDREATIASIHRAIDSGDQSWAREYRFQRRDGNYAHVLDRGYIIRDATGHAIRMIGGMSDLSERKQMEQQFLRVQRMESLGTLAGGISHDLNNVLAPILMSIELLKMQETNGHRMNILDTIEASAKRGADMVRQVLSFARGIDGQQVEMQVGHQIKEVEKIVNETFFKNIQVSTRIAPDLWNVQGDPTQLHQVLLNLCVNARDAMPTGGILTLIASNCVIDEHYEAMNVEARPGAYVLIAVEDTGTGMKPQAMERIFEPFFTTKELGKGTGLGLSTTLAIVKGHGGFIQVTSNLGKGSQFKVYLPAVVEKEPAAEEEESENIPQGQGECVLVIDDEEAVRQITQQTLEAFGYQVLTAKDGAEAVGVYASRREEIDLIVTDMMMPVMDGAAIIRVITRMNPEVKIIAASGLNANNMAAKAMAAGVKHFIPKPYTAGTLLKTVHQVLQA